MLFGWISYLLGKDSGIDFVVRCKETNSNIENIPIFVVSNTAKS